MNIMYIRSMRLWSLYLLEIKLLTHFNINFHHARIIQVLCHINLFDQTKSILSMTTSFLDFTILKNGGFCKVGITNVSCIVRTPTCRVLEVLRMETLQPYLH